jgi:quercetin dioxygenase-like cupin family protein
MDGMRWLKAAAAAAALVPIGVANPASATPGIDIDVETLAQSTVDGVDYLTKEITLAPGGSTGWHWHPGQVYGVIKEGTLTHYASDCSVDGVYPVGSSITEQSGPGYAQATAVPNPGCPFE